MAVGPTALAACTRPTAGSVGSSRRSSSETAPCQPSEALDPTGSTMAPRRSTNGGLTTEDIPLADIRERLCDRVGSSAPGGDA